MGVGAGDGAEARGTLVNRSDPVVAGRIRALLKTIITPETCRIEDLVSSRRRRPRTKARTTKRLEKDRDRLKMTRDLKMTAFESLMLLVLEKHLVLNRKRLNTYEARKEEIEGTIDRRTGAKDWEVQIRPVVPRNRREGGDPMDVDNFTTSIKGEGKDKSNQNLVRIEVRRRLILLQQTWTSYSELLEEEHDKGEEEKRRRGKGERAKRKRGKEAHKDEWGKKEKGKIFERIENDWKKKKDFKKD